MLPPKEIHEIVEKIQMTYCMHTMTKGKTEAMHLCNLRPGKIPKPWTADSKLKWSKTKPFK